MMTTDENLGGGSGESPIESDPADRDWDTAARIASLLETVERFASLDFSRRAAVGATGDDLDALAAGINVLGEEVEASQRELALRVEERTSELTELTSRLEAEVDERRHAEEQLEGSNTQLNVWVEHLQRLNDQVTGLTEMSNLFQVVRDRDEAFAVLGQFAPRLFTGTAGAVYVFQASRDVLERVVHWGVEGDTAAPLAPDECWALRRGRLHRSSVDDALRCGHLRSDDLGRSLCLPLTAQGEILGFLHLRWGEPAGRSKPETVDGDIAAAAYGGQERLAIAAGEQIALAVANLELRAALQAQSIRDPLTGLYNRRYLDETLERELQRAGREGTPVSLLMLDVDRFKTFNDTYGHAAGDAVLQAVAELILEAVRGEDAVCRYGGEELAVIMAGVGQQEAVERAEQIRRTIAEHEFTSHGQSVGSLTISVGSATYPEHADTCDRLLRAADAALYRAKEQGRNAVAAAR